MYNVIVLAEQALTAADADEVASLHSAIEDQRHYHVLIPCDNAAVRVETALGSLAASEVLAVPPVAANQADVERAQAEIEAEAQNAVATSVSALRALGAEASGGFSSQDPIESLEHVAREQFADEVIVLTRPHVVQEFLHLDWSSKARRRLGVPVLHLVEHEASPPVGGR
ncbi:MAG: hypothetical protein H0V49_12360 [Nocardioidaceae bacterium]|nr:hypothetical protein [Nocardioidaceae bacterium]